MNLTLNGTVNSFLLADLILFLFLTAIDVFVADQPTNKILKVILVIVCLIIAFAISFFVHA
jgi:hypothetical protein